MPIQSQNKLGEDAKAVLLQKLEERTENQLNFQGVAGDLTDTNVVTEGSFDNDITLLSRIGEIQKV